MGKIRTVKNQDGTFDVYTPYNKNFVAAIKHIGGARWNCITKAWTIPADSIDVARSAMDEAYGETDISVAPKLITIRVRFDSDFCEYRGGVEAFGKTLAVAWGRDSGAKVGEEAILEAGDITSGGSAKYWATIIKAGSVFRLTVPESIYAKEKDKWNTEIIESSDIGKRASLISEREKLLARLAEIEKELEMQ